MPLLKEGLREAIQQFVPKIGIKPVGRNGQEVSDDQLLEQSNADRAEKIALRVREIGIYRFGPDSMWAELSGPLPKGGTVDLQASEDALVATVHPTASSFITESRWDRGRKRVISLGKWKKDDHGWVWLYHVSGGWPGIPEPSSYGLVLRTFATVLRETELAIENARYAQYLESELKEWLNKK